MQLCQIPKFVNFQHTQTFSDRRRKRWHDGHIVPSIVGCPRFFPGTQLVLVRIRIYKAPEPKRRQFLFDTRIIVVSLSFPCFRCHGYTSSGGSKARSNKRERIGSLVVLACQSCGACRIFMVTSQNCRRHCLIGESRFSFMPSRRR